MTTALIGLACLLGLCFFGIRVSRRLCHVDRGFCRLRSGTRLVCIAGRGRSAGHRRCQNYNPSVIPLFILMDIFICRSDISADPYDAAYAALDRIKGGLALATMLACGGF